MTRPADTETGSAAEPCERMHILNGQLVAESQLLVSARDIGLLRGYGVFDFLITYHGGRPFHLADHVDRLYRSAATLHIDLPWPRSAVMDWTLSALAANGRQPAEHQIRILATGGVGPDAITASTDRPTLIVFIDPHRPYPARLYDEGAGVITADYTRHWPAAKSLNYIEGVMRVAEARRREAIEVVYHDGRRVFEGATSNIFALIDGRLCTPATQILAGITRKVILNNLDLADRVQVVDFAPTALRQATEVFLTASNKEIMPIVRIDDQVVGSGRVVDTLLIQCG